LPKFKEREHACEVCGEPVDTDQDLYDAIKDKLFKPREYVEYQMNMTVEEQERRVDFAREKFAEHEAEKARDGKPERTFR
jgi:hypothetical protein